MAASPDHPPNDPATPRSRWARATSDAGEDGREALRELAGSYWYCAYAWWRRTGLDADAAAAATLASFTRWLGAAPPRAEDSGAARLREWLPARLAELAAEGVKLDGPAALEIEPEWAERRYADEPPGAPDAIFQRRWAITVIEFTAATLHDEYAARGEEQLFEELLPFAGFDAGEDDRYTAAAARTGRTSGAMRKAVFDFRQRQRELLRTFVADTVADAGDADSEITALLCACDAPGPDAATAPLPSGLKSLRPDEVLARAMQSVRMTSGGAGGWTPPTLTEAALLFPQYEIVSLLGRGGMGAVYKGRQAALDRFVAIKLLPLEVSVDRDYADRFVREARAMAKLSHPNIIGIFDFGTTREGHLFFVMEFVDGANLHELIHPRGSQGHSGVSPGEALGLMAGVCDALTYAHAKGIVHRDIKPANVMVSVEGGAKVADFGLARLLDPSAQQGHTVTGTIMGTPDYMAPEQKRGMTVDHRADIFSLGVMLYEMLCGETPQGAFDPPSARIGCDTRIDRIVLRAMQQAPDRRYQSTQEMKADVDTARTPVSASSPPARPKQGRTPLWIASAVTLVGIGIVAWFVFGKKEPQLTEAGPAEKARAQSAAAAASSSPTGWQPLVSDANWRKTDATHEFKDGLQHIMRGNLSAQPSSPDGAVRTRIRIREGTRSPNIVIRNANDGESYKLDLNTEWTGIALLYVPPGNPPSSSYMHLGRHTLAKPLHPGDTLDLELRAQGDHLIGKVNGLAVIDVHDSEAKGIGRWAIAADDGWFESAEFQPLAAAAAAVSPSPAPQVSKSSPSAAEPWQDVARYPDDKVEYFKGATKTASGFSFPGAGASLTLHDIHNDGAIRMRLTLGDGPVDVKARSGNGDDYTLRIEKQNPIRLQRWDNAARRNIPIREFGTGKPLQMGNRYEIELRIVGQTITAKLDGAVLGTATDATLPTGRFGVGVHAQAPAAVVESVEFLDLDPPAKATPSPASQVSRSSTPAAATQDAPFVNSLGMKFVPVPIGGGATKGERVLFSIWDTRVQDYAAYAAANPQADGSWKTQQKDGVPVGREADHPVVGVSWEDAQAFCQWLTAKETAKGKLPQGMKYRLPSDEEWSWAVGLPPEQGATPEEKSGKNTVDFPWGKDWPPTKPVGNYADESFHAKFPLNENAKEDRAKNHWIEGYTDGYAMTSPVGSFPANAYGLYDMGGNVRQWCEDWWNAEHKDRVLRGAAWASGDRGVVLASNRLRSSSDARRLNHGFRCVLAGSSLASSAVSPAPAPAGSAAATKFPPGQWVKVFTKPEDLPAELRKPDSGVKWEDGWIRFEAEKPQRVYLLRSLINYGIRTKILRQGQEYQSKRLVLRAQTSGKANGYSLAFGFTGLVAEKAENGTFLPPFWHVKPPAVRIPAVGEEYTLEWACVGSRLIARFGAEFVKVTSDASFSSGDAYITGSEPLRDIEVMNLDGLPEAEALRILGVDEQGNAPRGKPGAGSPAP